MSPPERRRQVNTDGTTDSGIADGALDVRPTRFERAAFAFGHPWTLIGSLALLGMWIALNALAPSFGWRTPPDPPPYLGAQRVCLVVSLALIFASSRAQRRYRERLGRKLATLEGLTRSLDSQPIRAPRDRTQN